MTEFQAIWPVTDPTMPAHELIAEAQQDFRNVAARHRARITGTPTFQYRAGRNIPGSQGAARIIIGTAPAQEIPRRNYTAPQTT